MEKLVATIKRYIKKYGAFNIEEVDTKQVVSVNGGFINYFDLNMARVQYEEGSDVYFYNELDEDTLLDILSVCMEYAAKWDYHLNKKQNEEEL